MGLINVDDYVTVSFDKLYDGGMNVVYFDQGLGAAHSKRWSK